MIWAHFDPQAGHEQGGHRPAVVLSPASYNDKARLLVCCPMTTRRNDYPFEYPLAGPPRSVVLADQVKSMDWVARQAVRKGRISDYDLAGIRALIAALIGT